MIDHYFAYGSNMNPARMRARQVLFAGAVHGKLERMGLRFNKRAADRPCCAYANVAYSPAEVVEGVLYRLQSPDEIRKLDDFEGAPRLYSRDVWWVRTAAGPVAAWVYVANPAVIEEGLLPEAWYMQHVLAGREWLGDAYYRRLLEQPVLPVSEPAW